MIPKIIHYFWHNAGPMPAKLQACFDTWSRHCPGYELRRWDVDALGNDVPLWVRQAVESKKYAFAADYVRCLALRDHGGFYLDTDVEMLKSLDAFLPQVAVFCHESDSPVNIETGIIGAEKGHPFFAAMVEYYRNRPFIKPDGSFDMLPIPEVFRIVARSAGSTFTDVDTPAAAAAVTGHTMLPVLPSDYFSPISHTNMALNLTDRTVTIHHYVASWKPAAYRGKKRLQRLLGPAVTSAIIKLKDIILNRKVQQ